MTCSTCLRRNLPGGVRCIYCGEHFPPRFEFELGSMAPKAPATTVAGATTGKPASDPRKSAGLLGTLGLLALKAKSLLAVLKFGKIATTLISMLIFIWADAQLFGWKFGVGIGISILIHEMGHVIVNWRKGLKQTAPMFIPFLGAVIFIKQFPNDPTIESESGAGGPAAGMLAALACLGIGWLTKNPFWFALANLGFVINLFNLVPFPPLDGSHIGSVFSPQIWTTVLIGMTLFALKAPVPMLWMVILVGFIFRLGNKNSQRHLLAAPAVRMRMAAIYLVLALGLSSGFAYTTNYRTHLRGGATHAVVSATSADEDAHPASVSSESLWHTREWTYSKLSPEAKIWVWVVGGALFLPALLCWVITSALMVFVSGRPFEFRNLGLVAWMSGLYALLFGLLLAMPALTPSMWTLAAAYFAATVAALGYTGYTAAHRKPNGPKPAQMALLGRMLGWAAGAALLVAYATNSLSVFALTLLFVATFYLRYPWMLLSMAARLLDTMGDSERGIALRQRALALRPDLLSAMAIWTHIARLQISLARGSAALQALQAREELWGPAGMEGEERISAVGLDLRAAALMLLDRYSETLACYEQLLQVPADGVSPEARLLLVHARLAELARLRDWNDEAVAQADWCLNALVNKSGSMAGLLHAIRASALASLEDSVAAEEACGNALAASREPSIETRIALVRAQMALRTGDLERADRETSRAMRILPGHLEVQYWRGQSLISSGKLAEGDTLLHNLMRAYSQEHWGKRVADASPFVGAAPAGV